MTKLNLKSKICAVIPFYNEKQFILNVVIETLKYVDKIIAVNDGSEDGSEKLIQDLENVDLLDLKSNYGKGKALQAGFDECVKNDFNIIVTLDGDDQHDSKYIPEFIDKLKGFDIVIGNRLTNTKSMPYPRILSNRITSFFLSLKTSQNILDSQCGFRAYKKEVLQSVRTIYPGYEAESEILIYAARKGFNIGFVNIPTIYGDEKSKMNPIKAILGFIKVLFK
ncbi:MAG: glycosyltransferase family 2 protein [Ignavibacteria bacterium]|nr:glycosyltransferase family 2 protein [Ignavibacteria bacterium]